MRTRTRWWAEQLAEAYWPKCTDWLSTARLQAQGFGPDTTSDSVAAGSPSESASSQFSCPLTLGDLSALSSSFRSNFVMSRDGHSERRSCHGTHKGVHILSYLIVHPLRTAFSEHWWDHTFKSAHGLAGQWSTCLYELWTTSELGRSTCQHYSTNRDTSPTPSYPCYFNSLKYYIIKMRMIINFNPKTL